MRFLSLCLPRLTVLAVLLMHPASLLATVPPLQLPPPPDSLRAALAAAPHPDVRRLAVLLRVARAWCGGVEPATVPYALAAEKLARARADSTGVGRALAVRGSYYLAQELPNRAAPLLQRAARLLTPAAPAERAALLIDLGLLGALQNQPQQALRHYRQAYALYDTPATRPQQSDALAGIGELYLPRNQADSAATYLYRALRWQQRLGDLDRQAGTLGNLAALAYFQEQGREAQQLGRQALHVSRASRDSVLISGLYHQTGIFLATDSPTVALRYLHYAAAIRRRKHLTGMLYTSYQALGSVHEQLGQLDSAETYFRRGLTDYARAGGGSAQAGTTYLELALFYNRHRRYAEAAALARQALALRGEERLQPTDRATPYQILREAAESRHDMAAAYAWFRRETTIADSLREQENERLVADLRVGYQTEQAEQRAAVQTQRARIARLQADRARARARLWGAVAAALLLGIAATGWLYNRLRRERAKLAASEARLRALNATKDRLMSIIGHDLRAPVATFRLAMPLLRAQVQAFEAGELTEITDDLDQHAHALGALLDNLLHWARTQTDEVRPHPQPCDVRAALDQVARLYQPLAAAKGVTLTVDAPATLPIRTDPALLGAVVRNLTANAVKFTPAGGVVVLRAAATPGSGATVGVTDTGRGMTPDQLARLFDVNDPDRSTRGTAGEVGTGLGALICQRFVALLGGELRVSSAPGQGTQAEFEVREG